MFVYWCWIALHLTVTNVGFVLCILLFSVLCIADHCLLSNGLLLSLLRFTASDYLFGILLPFSCLSFDLRLLITSLVSCGHCLVSPLIYGFWLPLWYLVAIVLSVLRFTASDYFFGILWPLSCLSFDSRLLITSLVSCGHCLVSPSIYGFWLPLYYLVAIVLSVLRFTTSDYLFGIFWPLSCLSFEPLWYLVAIVLSFLWFTASDYLFGILWPFSCLSFDLRLLITSLVSCGHCLVSPLIYGFWLPLWYLVALVLSLLW
jgi:hypothetical protein